MRSFFINIFILVIFASFSFASNSLKVTKDNIDFDKLLKRIDSTIDTKKSNIDLVNLLKNIDDRLKRDSLKPIKKRVDTVKKSNKKLTRNEIQKNIYKDKASKFSKIIDKLMLIQQQKLIYKINTKSYSKLGSKSFVYLKAIKLYMAYDYLTTFNSRLKALEKAKFELENLDSFDINIMSKIINDIQTNIILANKKDKNRYQRVYMNNEIIKISKKDTILGLNIVDIKDDYILVKIDQ